MMPNKSFLKIAGLIVLCFGLFGCNNSDPTVESGMTLFKTTNPAPSMVGGYSPDDVKLAEKVKKDIADFKELYDVAVIVGEHEILVAYKVKHLQRFHMKRIEGKMNKMLEKKYPEEDFIVSSDYKIFIEAIELKGKLKDPNYSRKKAQEDLEKIIKLKKELT